MIDPLTLVHAERAWHGCYDSRRGDLFTQESYSHPAKMAVGLCFQILEHGIERGYWKPGDLILDPMCGIATTLVCGAVMGFRVLGIELENRFVEMAWQNIQVCADRVPGAGKMFLRTGGVPPFGVIQGDARYLPELLCDGAMSSPPYGDQAMPSSIRSSLRQLWKQGKKAEAIEGYRLEQERQVRNGQKFGVDSDETIRRRFEECCERERGNYAGAVTSPPYSDSIYTRMQRGHHSGDLNETKGIAHNRYGLGRSQIGNLRYPDGDIDAALSSPPYPLPLGGGKGIARDGTPGGPGMARSQYVPDTVGSAAGNIARLSDRQDVDAALCSPPWENQARGGQQGWSHPEKAARVAAERYASRARRGHPAGPEAIEKQMRRDNGKAYGESDGQVGKTQGETYCSAMLRVYRGLHAVVKRGGVVCLVTKNSVRNGRIRRLDEDTIRLMDAAGFDLIERARAMLREESVRQLTLAGGEDVRVTERKSFFKRLYERKRPDLAANWEDCLFFRTR